MRAVSSGSLISAARRATSARMLARIWIEAATGVTSGLVASSLKRFQVWTFQNILFMVRVGSPVI